MSLKDCLKRGVLITAANWHVVVVQFVADALFKTLLAVPIVGGVFLAVLLVGGDPGDLLARPVAEIVPTMASVLLAQPVALAAFLLALAVVVTGGSMLMFLVKGGTVTVLIAAERAAGAIEHPPLRLPAFRRATQFSIERFTGGAVAALPSLPDAWHRADVDLHGVHAHLGRHRAGTGPGRGLAPGCGRGLARARRLDHDRQLHLPAAADRDRDRRLHGS